MTEGTAVESDILGDSGWWRSARLQLLDFDVAIHSDSRALVELVDDLFEPLSTTGSAASALMLGSTTHLGAPGFFAALDGEVLVRTTAPTIAFAHLLFEANQQAIEQSRGLIRLHSAAVAAGGAAIVLPGPMGAGKSTLAAGLVRRGLGYLTDEVVAIDPANATVRPYPKPLSLGAAPAALGPLAWTPPPGGKQFLGSAGIVPARILGKPVTKLFPLGLVVMPRYVQGAPTRIGAVSAVDALGQLAAHTFHLDEPGTLGTLAEVIGDVPCYELTSGDLVEAVDAVLAVARQLAVVR